MIWKDNIVAAFHPERPAVCLKVIENFAGVSYAKDVLGSLPVD
jgi:hypothetical protein